MSSFDFISDKVLRSNVDRANELILELVLLSESENYQDRPSLISSLRKTIIIYTASIVEAVLLWKLKQIYLSGEADIDGEWDFKEIHKIHELEGDHEDIIWCKRKRVKKRVDKIDFLRITRLCEKHKLIRGRKLLEDIHKIRDLRNKLHIGNLANIDKDYQQDDLEFCFSVLRRVQKMIRTASTPLQPL